MEMKGVTVIVFNATFNNIVARSTWRPVLLVEETGVGGENHRPAVSCGDEEIFNYIFKPMLLT